MTGTISNGSGKVWGILDNYLHYYIVIFNTTKMFNIGDRIEVGDKVEQLHYIDDNFEVCCVEVIRG